MTTLYRLYAADGALLYVGIADSWPSRMKQHAKEKPWWGEVHDLRLTHYDDRTTAEAEEVKAIKAEKPRHNIVHNRTALAVVPTRTPADHVTWRCQFCQRQISTTKLDGYIQNHREGDRRWIVTCRGCDPDAEGGSYWIEINRIRTPDEVVRWTEHLWGKVWFSHRDWVYCIERHASRRARDAAYRTTDPYAPRRETRRTGTTSWSAVDLSGLTVDTA